MLLLVNNYIMYQQTFDIILLCRSFEPLDGKILAEKVFKSRRQTSHFKIKNNKVNSSETLFVRSSEHNK